MRSFLWISLVFLLALSSIRANVPVAEENEFAEFEDDEIEVSTSEPPQAAKEQEKKKESISTINQNEASKPSDFEDDDFGVENEEIEDFAEKPSEGEEAAAAPQPLKFADVPAHFRSNWASYQVEAIVLVIIMLYLVNYVVGRNTNHALAAQCFEYCKDVLESQFALVGDDGVSEVPEGGHLRRETDYSFSAWCSGRVGLNSMLLQMKMVKRQDLVSRIIDMFSPSNDRLTLKLSLEQGDMDPVVLILGEKKAVAKQVKEMLDLATFTSEKKSGVSTFNLPSSFALSSEQAEGTYAVLDPAVVNVLRRHEDSIEFIHISDQFSGPKPPEGETYTRLPEVSRQMIVSLNLSNCNDAESIEQLFTLVFHLLDKVRRLRLSKEAKMKADKKRKEWEEAFLRTTHQFRQEAAQARREEKTRERKQRLLDEEDPEKQRRLEAKELKREAKLKQPKMKQLKMK